MNLDNFFKKSWSFIGVNKGKVFYRSKGRGLKPLLFCLKKHRQQMRGAVVYDKIVGRAAALLLVYGGVKKVLTPLVSRGAFAYLQKNGVAVEYRKIVKKILNRTGKDLCPMEKLSQGKTAEEFLSLSR